MANCNNGWKLKNVRYGLANLCHTGIAGTSFLLVRLEDEEWNSDADDAWRIGLPKFIS